MALLLYSLFLAACGSNPIPLDRSRLPKDQQLAYEHYLANEYIVTDASDLFDCEYEFAGYVYDEEERCYSIAVAYCLYPKTIQTLYGLHTIVKLDDRIKAYTSTGWTERDMSPSFETHLAWVPYQEGYFFGFGGTWIFSCAFPDDILAAGGNISQLADILKDIQVTVEWSGGSETINLTYQKEMVYRFKPEGYGR